jgi:D-3-phosphoglycerate dehydrogenase
VSTVVVAYNLSDIDIERRIIGPTGAEIIHTRGLDTPEAQDAAAKADVLMVTIEKVPAELINRLENCKLICRIGTGLDAIDIPAATARGIWVTNVPDYAIDEVSTHAMALLLSYARRLPTLFTLVEEGAWWNAKRVGAIPRLKGQTLGMIGYGRIGQAMATKARGMGLNVVVYDPFVSEATLAADGATSASLETMLAQADYVSLHAPLTEQTRHILNAGTLTLMKPTAYIVNTARGALIDEVALLDAVQRGQIAGAALDVLQQEPIAADSPLLKEPRIQITPHAAWYSEEANEDVRVKGAEDVVRVLNGQRPRTPVNEIAG